MVTAQGSSIGLKGRWESFGGSWQGLGGSLEGFKGSEAGLFGKLKTSEAAEGVFWGAKNEIGLGLE